MQIETSPIESMVAPIPLHKNKVIQWNYLVFYLQNLCFPIVTTCGLDQIHLFVAVEGLK